MTRGVDRRASTCSTSINTIGSLLEIVVEKDHCASVVAL